MLELSKRVLEDFKVRKSVKRKKEFLSFLAEGVKELGYEGYVDESRAFVKNRNFVVGDIEKADIICTAHYDTCAVMPFPNFITPLNLFICVLYQVLIALLIIVCAIMVQIGVYYLSNGMINSLIITPIVIAFFCYMIMLGKANKNNYNDNTSGVVSLLEIMGSLQSNKQRVAFVFFDNEEKGLLGSVSFANKHKKIFTNKLIVNFDCVSDGDNILVLFNKYSKKDSELMKNFTNSFTLGGTKEVLAKTSAFYPSDQASFSKNKTIAVASLKYNRIFGYYMDRIHTGRDVIFDEGNIEMIKKALVSYIETVTESAAI